MKREQIEADLPLHLPVHLPFNITGGVQLAAGGGKEGEGEV